MTNSPRVLAITFLTVAFSSGCGDSEAVGAGPAVTRTDSAGVTVVETTRAAWADGGGWTVDAEPSLVIGQLEGEEPYLFGEVTGAIRLENGSIVMTDNQPRLLRWFDASGVYVRSAGGIGDGPGEFPRGTGQTERCGPNQIYVHDRQSRLILAFDTAGHHLRQFDLTDPAQATRGTYNQTCGDDGHFVAVGWGDFSAMPRLAEGEAAVLYSQYAPVWALGSSGELEHEFGSFLSSERVARPRGSGPHPFGRAVKFAAGGGRTFIGAGEGLAVGMYTERRLTEVWRVVTDELAVGEAFLEEYAAADTSMVDERYREWILGGVGMPPELPGYTELRATPGGHLWAKRFVVPWESHNRWGVFAPDGVFLGNVELPVELTVTDIGDDYVLGVTADELDVQRVQLHPIRR